MAKYGPALEKHQLLLGRLVNIGSELFAITAVALRADGLLKSGSAEYSAVDLKKLVDFFTADAKQRIRENFEALAENHDRASYSLAQSVLEGRHTWIEKGIS
jgi:hypothetical protein